MPNQQDAGERRILTRAGDVRLANLGPSTAPRVGL